jgi:hypothetical protein
MALHVIWYLDLEALLRESRLDLDLLEAPLLPLFHYKNLALQPLTSVLVPYEEFAEAYYWFGKIDEAIMTLRLTYRSNKIRILAQAKN